jgi:Ricin-type beta-trefoil lectin domain
MKNKLVLILVSTTLAFSSTILTIFSQSAAAERVQNKATGMCLEGDRGESIFTNGCTYQNRYQHWVFIKASSDIWVFKNNTSDLCLDSDRKGNVYAKSCNQSNPYQRWVFSANNGGTYQNKATGMCLDSDNKGKVYTYGCAAQYAGQKWNY